MSLSNSEVTVVVVNWNGRQHLETLMPTLLPQEPGEILVVDNGSSDGSQEFLSRIDAVTLLQNPRNQGFAHPNNQAAERARGKVLALLNNDMRCHPDWLSAGLKELESEHVACVGSRILDWSGKRIDYNGSSLQYLGYALQKDIGRIVEDVTAEDRVLFSCGGAMLVYRDVYRQLGGFDEDFFAVYEDVDFGWRLWLAGHEVALAPDSITYHRSHGTFEAYRLAKMRYLMHRNALLTIAKNYEDENWKRIGPVALLTALRRAIRCSGVRKEAFHMWSEVSEPFPDRSSEEQTDAWNHLIAVDDVLQQWAKLRMKRQKVQNLRKRSDEEILKLFEDPFRTIVEDRKYLEQEKALIQFFGIDQIFEDRAPSIPSGLPDPAPAHARQLREEILRLQWFGVREILHPSPRTSRSRLQRLLDLWKGGGFSAIWRSFRELLRRVF